jgi:hypothetical protein
MIQIDDPETRNLKDAELDVVTGGMILLNYAKKLPIDLEVGPAPRPIVNPGDFLLPIPAF